MVAGGFTPMTCTGAAFGWVPPIDAGDDWFVGGGVIGAGNHAAVDVGVGAEFFHDVDLDFDAEAVDAEVLGSDADDHFGGGLLHGVGPGQYRAGLNLGVSALKLVDDSHPRSASSGLAWKKNVNVSTL
jgi:hypothetical protein